MTRGLPDTSFAEAATHVENHKHCQKKQQPPHTNTLSFCPPRPSPKEPPQSSLPLVAMSLNNEEYIKLTRELANSNVAAGGRPSSCVLVDVASATVVASAADQVTQSRDPLALSVLIAIREATKNSIAKDAGKETVSGKGQVAFIVGQVCGVCSSALQLYGIQEIVNVPLVDQKAPSAAEDAAAKAQEASAHAAAALAAKEKNLSKSITDTWFSEVPVTRPTMEYEGMEMPTWGDRDLSAAILKMSYEQHKKVIANRGTPMENLVKDIKELNNVVRANYAKFHVEVGAHLRPCIIASDYEPMYQGVGGTFTLYNEDGTVEKISPSPDSYHIFKTLGHVTLGVNCIVLPFLDCPDAYGWQDKLTQLLKQIELVLRNMKGCAELGADVISFLNEMLGVTVEYIKSTLQANHVDIKAFQEYAAKVSPYIMKAIAQSSRIQMEADLPALLKWKRKLGDKWKDLYVIIPSVWPVSGDNPRERMLAFLLPNPSAQILKVQNQSGEAELLATLGRVMGDRSMIQLTLGSGTANRCDASLSYATPRDLLSSSSTDAMVNYLLKCQLDELDDILLNLSPEATLAIQKFRAHKQIDPNHPAINTLYQHAMSAQAFGDALRTGQAGAAPSSVGGCPFARN